MQPAQKQTRDGERGPQSRESGLNLAVKVLTREDLNWLLNHELRSARRYRYFVSLIMAVSWSKKVSIAGMTRMMQESLRESDEWFELSDRAVILMNHTDKEGAVQGLSRLRAFYNGKIDLRYAVATFPRGGAESETSVDAAGLIKIAEDRLLRARQGEFGDLICSD